MTKFFAVVAGIVVLGLLGGSYLKIRLDQANDPFADCRSGAVGGGAIGGPFELVDGNGKLVTDTEIITKPSLIYFGYTFCPDICPLDNARNAEAVDILEEKGFDVQPVFITIDPARDTPEVVRDFAQNLHPKMVGLTGSDAQTKAVSQAYKTYFKKQDDGGEFYLMDHSTFTYLVLPGAGFVEFFKRDDSADVMAEKAACYVAKSGT